jgi:hypothetical protein
MTCLPSPAYIPCTLYIISPIAGLLPCFLVDNLHMLPAVCYLGVVDYDYDSRSQTKQTANFKSGSVWTKVQEPLAMVIYFRPTVLFACQQPHSLSFQGIRSSSLAHIQRSCQPPRLDRSNQQGTICTTKNLAVRSVPPHI